jgi:ketosteroid isomerase-like protein
MLTLDMSGQADLYAEDGVFEFPFAPIGLPTRFEGREAVRSMLVAAGRTTQESGHRPVELEDLRVHVTTDPEIVISEFAVVVESDDGTRTRVPYISVLQIRNGEILCYRDYATPRTAAVKLNH